MKATLPAQSRSRRPGPSFLTRALHLFNAPAVRLAGGRYLPIWALLRHRGRRSGRTFATPVAARRIAGGFIVPLAWGENADWCRNVLASGDCVIRWAGAEHHVEGATVVGPDEGMAAFRSFERRSLRAFGVKRFMLLRDRAAAPSGPMPAGGASGDP